MDVNRTLFVVQIATLAHEVNRAYCEAVSHVIAPPWDICPVELQQSAVNGVDFWLSHMDSHPSAGHNAWLAQRVADGWRLGPVVDHAAKTHPNIRPFDALPREQQVKDWLFRGVVKAVTYSQEIGPKIAAQTNLVNAAMAEAGLDAAAWNALPEEDRKARCDDLQARSNAQRERIMACIATNGLTPAQWDAKTEDERQALLNGPSDSEVDTLVAELESAETLSAGKPTEDDLPVSPADVLVAELNAQHEKAKAMPLPSIELKTSTTQPDYIDIAPGVKVQLAAVTHAAQLASKLTEEEWNNYAQPMREAYIQEQIEKMRSDASTATLV